MKHWPLIIALGIVFTGCIMICGFDESDASGNDVAGSGTYNDPYTYIKIPGYSFSSVFGADGNTVYITVGSYIEIDAYGDTDGAYGVSSITSGHNLTLDQYYSTSIYSMHGNITGNVGDTLQMNYHVDNFHTGQTNYTYYLTLTLPPYTVSVYSAGGGTVSGGGTYIQGSTATITATPNTGYHFTNWSDGNTSNPRSFTVTEDVSLTAYFAINTYTVAWNDWDGTHLETDSNVPYGSTPSYDGNTPTRPNTPQYVYTFSGWSPAISTVTGDQTYTAQYTEIALHTVVWKNWDGTILETDLSVPEGTLPTYDGTTPTRPETSEYRYSFDGWSPTVAPVTADIEYTAQFTTTNLFSVIWRNWNGAVLETDVSVPEGTTPVYNGSTPTRADTESFTYEFSGWNPAVGPISGYTEYTAQFTAIPLYLVTWLNWDGTMLDTEKVPEGETPVYNGATPTRAMTVQYIYTFAGWSPTIVPITEDSEYIAQFSRTYREYTDGEWAYGILDSGYAILLGYTGSGGIVQIPVTVGGKTVSNIGIALKNNGSVTGVVIPSNIQSIAYDAFSGTSITEVLNLSELNITGVSYGLNGATVHTSIPGWFYISDVEYTDRVPDNSSTSKLIRIIPLLILIGIIVMIIRNRVEDE